MRSQQETTRTIGVLRDICNQLTESNLKASTRELVALRKKYPFQEKGFNLHILHHIILQIANATTDNHYNLLSKLLKNLLRLPDFIKELEHSSSNHDSLTPLALAEKLSREIEGMEATVSDIKNAMPPKLEDEIASLKAALAKEKMKTEKLTAENTALEKTAKEKEAALEAAQKQLADETARHRMTSKNYLDEQGQVCVLQGRITRAETHISKLQKDIVDDKAKFNYFSMNARALYENKRMEVYALRAQLAESKERLAVLQEDVPALQESNEAIQEENTKIWAMSESTFFILKPNARNVPRDLLAGRGPDGQVYGISQPKPQ